jgi:HEAT repeat protein
MGLDPTLLTALHSEDRYQQFEAALALAASGDRDALPALHALLDHPDGLVASSALYASWMLSGELPAIDPVLAALASGDEEQVQTSVQVLAQIGDALLPDLRQRLNQQSPYSPQILRLLGDIGGPQALQLLHSAAQADNTEIANCARQVLEDWDD